MDSKTLLVKSPSFGNNARIPSKYTCMGIDVNPALEVGGVPKETKSLVLIVDDPDTSIGVWDHWVVWNIPSTGRIAEDSVPGVEGVNSAGAHSWHGPCPPSGTHRYFFKVYALDSMLSIPASSRKKDVEKAMQGRLLARGELIGLFSK